MKAIICFIVGFLLAKLVNYIEIKRNLANAPKTLNIGDSEEVIEVTSGMVLIEIETTSTIHNFNLEGMDNVVFYISSTDKYILYKDKDFRYVKLDIPLY